MTDTPFKARINGKRGILVLGNHSIIMNFTGTTTRLEIQHTNIRCIQCRGENLLINADKDGTLMIYQIVTSGAKKIFRVIST